MLLIYIDIRKTSATMNSQYDGNFVGHGDIYMTKSYMETIDIIDIDCWRIPSAGGAYMINPRGQKDYRFYYGNEHICSFCRRIVSKLNQSSFMGKRNLPRSSGAYIWVNKIKSREVIHGWKFVWNGHLVNSSVSLAEILCYVNI